MKIRLSQNHLVPELNLRLILTWLLLLAAAACSRDSDGIVPSPNGSDPSPDADVTIDTTLRFQTIVGGWEAVAQGCHLECLEQFSEYADELLDMAVEEVGLTRLRLEVRSGVENPEDPAGRFLSGEIGFQEWKEQWYDIVNDNGDPNSVDPSGFQFTELDATVEDIVLPMKQRLEARGEELYVNLTYVDFGTSGFEHHSDSAEYAEFVVATFRHLDEKYGLVPDALEIILEPDVAEWSPRPTGEALVAAAERLRAAGYEPDVIAPSHSGMAGSVSFFDEMIQVDGVLDELTDLSYHRYRGVSDQALSDIADRAENHGLRTGMLEHIGSGHEDLHDDLTVANNSAWQQFGLGFVTDDRNSPGLYLVVDPATSVVRLSNMARFLSQYFNAIRPGAVRVEATSEDPNLKPIAFLNADGRRVVVVNADTGGSFTVGGLPSGTYEIGYTTPEELVPTAEERTLKEEGVLQVSLPAGGVLSIRQK